MADLYLTPAEKYTAALGGFYYGDLPEPGTVYTQLIKDILDGSTPDKEPKNVLARFIYSLYISDLGDPYPRYELAKLLHWKLHGITPTKSGSVLTVTIDGREDYMTINTDLSRLWYKVLFGSKTDVITEFPYIFNTMQNKLSDWELFGNTEVSGTPSPDSPITPQGTGERTGNLFVFPFTGYLYCAGSGQNRTVNETIYKRASVFKVEPNTTYTFSGKRSGAKDTYGRLFLFDKKPAIGVISTHFYSFRNDSSITFTTESNEAWCLVQNDDVSEIDVNYQMMLNEGSEAIPYEPYGYKIPISSAGQTTPIYLGEVQTTRIIKKLVLDGTEDFQSISSGNNKYFRLSVEDFGEIHIDTTYCTHFESVSITSSTTNVGIGVIHSSVLRKDALGVRPPQVSTTSLEDFTTYLTQQHNNGTPVTVWYVLATPTTGIFNEPLMKIGDYADSMSMFKTGIDIQTVIGQNTLDVLTTVKPSSMRIEYTSADENRYRSNRISLLKIPLAESIKI